MPGIQPLPGARNPWVDSLPRFIQGLAMQKVAQNFRAKEAEMQREYNEAEDKRKATALKLKSDTDRASTVSEGKLDRENVKPTTSIKDYQYAVGQFAKGKAEDPGSFTDFKRKNLRSGATRISMGEKVALHSAKKEVDRRGLVKSPNFSMQVTKDLKTQHGENWGLMEPYKKYELQYREMDTQVKAVYPKAIFDDDRNPPGWYVGNKMVVRYKDPTKHRQDKRH
jgi:hypothetical protein